jgi:hypothetical protein
MKDLEIDALRSEAFVAGFLKARELIKEQINSYRHELVSLSERNQPDWSYKLACADEILKIITNTETPISRSDEK